jgi:hypothetical protein
MIIIHVSADVESDRRVVLTLPPEVPIGRNELVVSITPASVESTESPRQPPFSLADWADANAEHWGSSLNAADVEGFTGRGV